ncbi:hypothetical protein NKY44_22290 [Sinorhizobium meliloti]|uniref:hypothetical protein n=1 Tax=Rhizobium meliloti TaxID=382 RepID=UPI003D652D0F
MKRGVIVGWFVACSLSGLSCWWTYRIEVDQSSLPFDFVFEKPEKGPEAPASDQSSSEIADAIQFQLRPLFSPSRKPVKVGEPEPTPELAEIEAAPPEPVAVARLKLLGTEETGAGASALIMDEDTGASDWVAVGSGIGGWRVAKIGTDTVLLTSDGEPGSSLKLSLYPE